MKLKLSPQRDENLPDIPIEELARYPMPGTSIPSGVRFSPDGVYLTWLHSLDNSINRSLCAHEIDTREQKVFISADQGSSQDKELSLEEQLLRERARQRGLGVTSYKWNKQDDRILVPLQGDLFVYDLDDKSLNKLIEANGKAILDPQFSPDGNWISWVQDAELYIIPVEGGSPRQLTEGARGTGKTHGLAEYIAQEEMGRAHGYWWSPDSKHIAFTEVDETHIPIYRIMHLGKDELGETAQEDHRYPFAGSQNAKVRLGLISIEKPDPIWIDLDSMDWEYLARVDWLDSHSLYFQLENREQTVLDLCCYDLKTAESKLVLQEKSDIWINLHNVFRSVKLNQEGEKGFLWASERNGFRHLYVYTRDGELLRQITDGQWQVDAVSAVDAETGTVYFTGTKESPVQKHLYSVPLEGGGIMKLSEGKGIHSVSIDPKFRYFLDTYDSTGRPPVLLLCSLDSGEIMQTIYDEPDPRVDELKLVPPEIVSFKNRDGIELYAAIYRPSTAFGKGPFPTVVSVYGGPHAQRVINSWNLTTDLRAQYLTRKGFLVVRIDNQGSARRGLAFEGVIRHQLSKYEVSDQVDGINMLVENGLCDPKRVGIFGWSYGGYMSIMSMLKEPNVFKVAVAGAPVTNWDGYDTHYTERYMGTPQSNPDGYEESGAMKHAENLKGKLLIIHGLIDENVHFRNTARFMKSLIKARKRIDMLMLPDSRHIPRSLPELVYLEESVTGYFIEHL